MYRGIGYHPDFLKQYIPMVRQILQDYGNLNMNAVIYDDGTEFSDEELLFALQKAQAKWEIQNTFIPFVNVIAFPAAKFIFAMLAAAEALRLKAIYYTRNNMSAGDNVDVNDLENKATSYISLAEYLEKEALDQLEVYRINTFGYASRVVDVKGGKGSGGLGGT